MTERSAIAAATARNLRHFAGRIAQTNVLVGFDGFVDSIIQVVDQRQDDQHYEPIATIDRFGQKIIAMAGHSGNFELVRTLEKLGGNGPIMANALATAGLPVTFVGCCGDPDLHAAFQPLAQRANVISIAQPGFTDALEFSDGKLLMGKYNHMVAMSSQHVIDAVGAERFAQLARQSKLIGAVNWTMMPHLDGIWSKLRDILEPGSDTLVFADLCDTAKHAPTVVSRAMHTLAELRDCARVVLGLNLSESTQVASALGITVPTDAEAAIIDTASAIRAALDIHCVVIHPRKCAAAARQLKRGSSDVETGIFFGPFTDKPKLSTGGGDNFNAGFCLGLLAELALEQCLCTGNSTSGFYVRNAHSPSLDELIAFCDNLPA